MDVDAVAIPKLQKNSLLLDGADGPGHYFICTGAAAAAAARPQLSHSTSHIISPVGKFILQVIRIAQTLNPKLTAEEEGRLRELGIGYLPHGRRRQGLLCSLASCRFVTSIHRHSHRSHACTCKNRRSPSRPLSTGILRSQSQTSSRSSRSPAGIGFRHYAGPFNPGSGGTRGFQGGDGGGFG